MSLKFDFDYSILFIINLCDNVIQVNLFFFSWDLPRHLSSSQIPTQLTPQVCL